jgi:hypothetical protein
VKTSVLRLTLGKIKIITLISVIFLLDSCVLAEERRHHLARTGCCLANKESKIS